MKFLRPVIFLFIAGAASAQARYTHNLPIELIGARDVTISGERIEGGSVTASA